MALDTFKQTDVATRLGSVRLWRTPQAESDHRPLIFAMPGILAGSEDLETLVASLTLYADGCVMRPIRDFGQDLALTSMVDLSAVLDEVIEREFAGRQVVLLGVSSSAVAMLGCRARNLARIVAVEPPLVTGGLWPVLEQLRQQLASAREPRADMFAGLSFGVGQEINRPLDHTGVLEGLTVPVDVVLADEPLEPERPVARFPSLVGAAERLKLSATPGVRLHVMAGTGHAVLGQALPKVGEIVYEACRRAGRALSPARLAVDEPLLEATPPTLARVLHHGAGGEAFALAFARISPKCDVVLRGEAAPLDLAPGSVEAVVLSGPVAPDRLAELAAALALGGHLIARWRTPDAALNDELAAAGLSLRQPVDAAGTGVVRAQKLAPGETPKSALLLHSIAYAAVLMDIRTRLPSAGLAADPDLRVVYELPKFNMAELPREAPKVLLLQRPLESRFEVWRDFMADCIAKGWLLVLEYDDYPPLIAEVRGREPNPAVMKSFSYMHGVQTASPPLVELFRPFNPEVVLFENAVFDLPPFPEAPPSRRIFYGAVFRGRYAIDVARSLGAALEGLDDVEILAIGDKEVFDALPTQNKRWFDYMGYESYLDLMAQCAVSLSPIEALPFRDTKSDAKFLDAARAGVLTIASPTIYERVIRHGENGLLAREIGDWAPLLRRALTDEPERRRMAKAAYDEVRDGRMFADQAAARRDWYWRLWNRRAELNEALMARIPGLREAVAARLGA